MDVKQKVLDRLDSQAAFNSKGFLPGSQWGCSMPVLHNPHLERLHHFAMLKGELMRWKVLKISPDLIQHRLKTLLFDCFLKESSLDF